MMSREAQVQATAVIAGSRGGGGDPVVRTVLRNIAYCSRITMRTIFMLFYWGTDVSRVITIA